MKCLVTGGAGFIGSHLSDRLITDGHEVVVVDNLITGSESNIEHLRSNPRFTFVKADASLLLGEKFTPDLIYHLASPASPEKYQKHPIETLLVNTIGTKLMLDLARDTKARLVFASTSEVYGDPQEHPQKETYWGNVNPAGVRSCYDEGKRAGEAFVMSYVRKFGVDAKIVRIFNTYGPRMDINDGRVIVNFIKQIKEQTPLTVYGKGTQTRSMCFVSDMVEGFYRVGTHDISPGEIINLGNPEEISVLDLAKRIMDITGYQKKVAYKELPEDDPERRQPDISKAMKLIEWKPKVGLGDGIKKTLKFFGIEQQ